MDFPTQTKHGKTYRILTDYLQELFVVKKTTEEIVRLSTIFSTN